MKKRLAKLIIITFGSPILLYYLGIWVNNNIFVNKSDHLINDGSASYYAEIILACGLVGLMMLAGIALVGFLCYLGLRCVWNWVKNGYW